jgi:polyisoprenoid-binding protein YceI
MALPLTPGDWTLDPAHSVVGFSVRHLGISLIRGRFTDVTATLTVGADLGASGLFADVAMASVTTGNEARDGHLQSTEIFNAENQPTMSFRSTSIAEAGGGRYQLVGDMTINGTTRTETLDVELVGTETNPMDSSLRAGFAATGSIDRTAYGIDWNVPMPDGGGMLAATIDITLDTQLIGPSAD